MSILRHTITSLAGALWCMCFATTASWADGIVTFKRISEFSPKASAKLVQAFVEHWNYAEEAKINSDLRIQHFIAQVATETYGLRVIEENLSYKAERLREVFPTRVSPADALKLQRNPIATANHVYGNRRDLGNGPPNDGWNYRGSGFLQLTGKANFKKRGQEVGLPLEQKPDLARQPREGMIAATAYWKSRGINSAADKDDLEKVRALVNGGKNGLPEARIWIARAKRIFFSTPSSPQESASKREEMRAVQDVLVDLGVLDRGPEETVSRSKLSAALKAFQHSRGIPETGQYDEDTLYELSDPDNKFKD